VNHLWKRLISVSLVTMIVVVALASLAFAEGGPAAAAPGQKGAGARIVLAYIAGKSGADLTALGEAFKSGKTLREIAAEKGISWSAIEAVFMPNQAKKEENKQKAIANLEKRIAALTGMQTEVMSRIAKLQEQTDKIAARIPTMRNETVKGFAQRQVEILRQRLALANENLALLGRELALARDQLAYAQSL